MGLEGVTPTHQDGIAAAKRVQAANNDGTECDVFDVMCMLTYQLSLELRRIPERARIEAALQISRQIMKNTRESLD